MTSAPTPWVGDEGAKPDASRSGGASFMSALVTLYALTVRQHLHGKRWIVTAALFFLPAGLAVLVRSTAHGLPPMVLEFLLAMMFVPQLLLPLAALLYASGMIQDEQEDQTLTYLLIRPLPKWAIYTVKLLATLTTTVTLTAVFTVLTYAAIYIGAKDAPDDVWTRAIKTAGIHSMAVGTYCCIFGLLSLITKRTLVIGIVYTAVVEGLLANLPFGIRLFTVIYYSRLIAYHAMPFLTTEPDGRPVNMADEAWQLGIRNDPDLLQHPQVSTCFVVLLGASLACTILAAWLCSQREFHVKTPEKA